MTDDAKRELKPRRRFFEFQEESGWAKTQIGALASSESSALALNKLSLEPKGYPVYGADGLVGFINTFAQDEDYIAIIKDGSGVGRLSLVREKSSLLGTLAYLKPKKNSTAILPWLFYYLSSINLQKYVKGSGIPHIYFSDYASEEIGIPSPREQQKIADCLSSLDELIVAHSRKLNALKTHKNGLIQRLFPREGETLPRLRFPDFRDAPEWEERRLGEVGNVTMCKRVFANETNNASGVPFYKIGTLGGKPDAYISKDLFEDYKTRYSFPRKGEVLITCSGTVGKCLPYDGRDAYFQDSNIVWIDNPSLMVSNEFLLRLLSKVDWGKLNSTTITRIYGSDLRDLAIKCPSDPKEQETIANCLTSIDDLIIAVTKKLDRLKTHKSGLMQQLFPSPDEVEA